MSSTTPIASACERRRIQVRGRVQGVGFRPFVYRLARRLGVSGFVHNSTADLVIEAQASPGVLETFTQALMAECPPMARVQELRVVQLPPVAGANDFEIIASREAASSVQLATVMTDTAVCSQCLREMRDPCDRRYGYALVNCTHCGPRYSIVRGVPYDRVRTTMADFVMCPACAREYARPDDRRFHAQPISCPQCGPQVQLVDPLGRPHSGDPISLAAQQLADGQILAIKGLGGFHLAVRADRQAAVQRLRKLKQRDAKPLALMVADLPVAQRLVRLSAAAVQLMTSPISPIILAHRRDESGMVAAEVAPQQHRLGLMLPYTPMQHLFFDALARMGHAGMPLVMTSGNLTDEPLAIDHADALRRLGAMCDGLLWHDRPIQRGVDDSILLDLGDGDPLPIRRARGLSPGALPLPEAFDSKAVPGLCVGGELKNTVAVVRDGQAILSQHLGDLSHPLAYENFRLAIADLCGLFNVHPGWIAHDLHPAYLSTIWARELARQWKAPLVAVQHHHAHAAAVLAEHGLAEPALAVVCDGVGYGSDDQAWGGELLRCDLLSFERLASLRPMWLAGGDAAARDIRRCALALLHQVYGDDFARHPAAVRLVPDTEQRGMFAAMIQRRISGIASSGAGRYFDAIAALLGLCQQNDYEAQAAQYLESAAAAWREDVTGLVATLPDSQPGQLDLSPVVRQIVDGCARGEPIPRLAAIFHESFARMWDAAVQQAAASTGLRLVCLSGGVFCNANLTRRLTQLLEEAGLRVLRHCLVPPGDGGLSLGQAAVANARIRAGLFQTGGG